MARSLTKLISVLKLMGVDVAERAGRISDTSDTLDTIASEEAAIDKKYGFDRRKDSRRLRSSEQNRERIGF